MKKKDEKPFPLMDIIRRAEREVEKDRRREAWRTRMDRKSPPTRMDIIRQAGKAERRYRQKNPLIIGGDNDWERRRTSWPGNI
ncbi:MAG: hypothetical protein AAB407_03585 [Patescibacteria group bacterium]